MAGESATSCPFAHQVQDVFQLMREFAEGREAHETGTAFDGVYRAEDFVHQRRVGAGFLDAQQLTFDLRQMLARFIDKLRHELLIIEHLRFS